MSKIFAANKLKIQGNKTLLSIALILLLTVSGIMASMPAAKATSASVIPTYTFCTASPSPAGVNQTVTIVFWLDKPPVLNAQGF